MNPMPLLALDPVVAASLRLVRVPKSAIRPNDPVIVMAGGTGPPVTSTEVDEHFSRFTLLVDLPRIFHGRPQCVEDLLASGDPVLDGIRAHQGEVGLLGQEAGQPTSQVAVQAVEEGCLLD